MNDKISATKDPVGLHTLKVIAKANRFNTWMYDQFKHQLKGEILEIGSGIGNISKLVIEEGHFITLSDYNEEYCEVLKKQFPALYKRQRNNQYRPSSPGFRQQVFGLS